MRLAIPILLLVALAAPAADEPAPVKKGPPTLMERVEKDLKGDEKPFTLIVQIYIRPGMEGDFETQAAKAAKASGADKGCLGYEFHRDLEKVGHYTLIERWSGPAALREHLGKEHTKQLLGTLDEVSSSPPTAVVAVQVGGK
jgi:quinol monooxygenase YgiN